MSFIETPRFPTAISYNSAGGPSYSTRVVQVQSGHEKRNQNWSFPRHRYDVAYGVKQLSDLEDLITYLHAMTGRTHGFRFKDWADFKSCKTSETVDDQDQALGSGDAAEDEFQIIKTYTEGSLSLARYITKPVSGTVTVALDGVNQASGWSVDTATGIITFSTPPGAGVVVSAGYEFDVPVRFDIDHLSTQITDYQMGTATAPMIEIRI